ncbi:MAG: methyltransferase domain-containing protein [Kofleriaceae bacterium]
MSHPEPGAAPGATVVPSTTPQLALWTSGFGRAYTDRNDQSLPARQRTWARILADRPVARALEVGCNVGWNLRYLQALGVPELYGIEPQADAVARARRSDPALGVLRGTAFELPFRDAWFDLVFTSGVLIHIAPADLGRALDEMYRVARRYLVAIEYDHPTEVAVPYRGELGALWKRDHGALWRARFPSLRPLLTLEVGADDGYDDCTVHLFEKP